MKPRSAWIDGSATFTTVASRITMNWARQTMTRTSQRLVSPDAGGSTNSSGRSEATLDTATSGRWGSWGLRILGTIRRGAWNVARTGAPAPLRRVRSQAAAGTARYSSALLAAVVKLVYTRRSGRRGGNARGGSSPLSRIVLQARCYPARRFLPLSSRGLGRRPLTAETGVRIPVAVPHEARLPGGFRRSPGRLRARWVTRRRDAREQATGPSGRESSW